MTIHPSKFTLEFNSHPIRIDIQDGVPWFSLTDISAAVGDGPRTLEVVLEPEFPVHATRICNETDDGGMVSEGVLLSPVGVWYFAHLLNAKGLQKLAAWAKREAVRLCPDPRAGDLAMFLTYADKWNGSIEMPPYPWKYSGRRSEWYALQDALPQALDAHHRQRRNAQAQKHLAALEQLEVTRTLTPSEHANRQFCQSRLSRQIAA
jgi:hypothetical protein